jgi:hypothetical protein
MSFLKHIGTQGDRKVAILYRTVPNEDHMCLVIYPQVLPAPWHDTIMKVLESAMGQQSEPFADALHRSLLPDGRNILETLHSEKMIKKIRTSDVLVTPAPNASIRLDELNSMLSEMKTGEAAVRRMAENDAARGLVEPGVKRAAEAQYKESRQSTTPAAAADGALDDRTLAANMLAQATRMEQEARGLVAEAARMKKEAEKLHPGVVAAEPSAVTATPAVKRRGRTAKAQVVADAAQ